VSRMLSGRKRAVVAGAAGTDYLRVIHRVGGNPLLPVMFT
jgi:hypothetical protein